MVSVLGFLAILTPLVFFHELGHFLFARLFGVKAEVFSIGFGPRIWGRKIGETDWRIAAIPLGGFVKLLGEDPSVDLSPEDVKRSLQRQSPWARFWIFFGGPLFNFLLAIVVFMAILAIGEPHASSVLGRVVPGSIAAQAGLRSGDRILTIQGNPISKMEELFQWVIEHPQDKLELGVRREGVPTSFMVSLRPATQPGFGMYGESKEVGQIPGVQVNPRSTRMGISDPKSPAGLAGLETGDEVLSIQGSKVNTWEQLEAAWLKLPSGVPVELGVRMKSKSGEEKKIVLTKPDGNPQGDLIGDPMGDAWGLRSAELFVEKAVDKSPAQAAGVRSGDRLVAVGAQKVYSFMDLRAAVQKSGEESGRVELKWERKGQLLSASVTPTATVSRDPVMKKVTQFTVGVVPLASLTEGEQVIERVWNPIKLVWQGTLRMVTVTARNFIAIGKMFTGDVSVSTLGGPILIGKIAGESLTHGLIAFLSTMAMLSVGLGVLNILPVPVLDGGHILLLLLEVVRKKPLTLRQMEIVQQVGLSLILVLMFIVLKNDVLRLSFFQ
jgi:regulator of sigma E protease